MKYGPKQTLTNSGSAIGASASEVAIGAISKLQGAVGLIVRCWLNQDGSGDRIPSAFRIYPHGTDGATTVARTWNAIATGGSLQVARYSAALNKASVLDVPPANAWLSVICLMTQSLLPCMFDSGNLYVSTGAGGTTDYTQDKVVFECIPVYPDGHPEGSYSSPTF